MENEIRLSKALVVKEPWVSMLLDGTKTWELRGSSTTHRGQTGLIASGSGLVLGCAELTSVAGPLTRDEIAAAADLHKIDADWRIIGMPYRTVYAWSFEAPRRFGVPLPYVHPRGAVIWVRI